MKSTSFRNDTRATSFTIGYTIDVAITMIVITGVIVGVSGFIADQQHKAVQQQTDVISDRVASAVSGVDDVGSVDGRTNASMQVYAPDSIVTGQYTIGIRGDGNAKYIAVHDKTLDITARTPIQTDAAIENATLSGSDNLVVVYENKPGATEPVMTIRDGDDP